MIWMAVQTDCQSPAISFVDSNVRSFWSIWSPHWKNSGWINDNVKLTNRSTSFENSIHWGDPRWSSVRKFSEGFKSYSSVFFNVKLASIRLITFKTYFMPQPKPPSWECDGPGLQSMFSRFFDEIVLSYSPVGGCFPRDIIFYWSFKHSSNANCLMTNARLFPMGQSFLGVANETTTCWWMDSNPGRYHKTILPFESTTVRGSEWAPNCGLGKETRFLSCPDLTCFE